MLKLFKRIPSRHLALSLVALAGLGLSASTASALTFFATDVVGGDPSSSLIGVNITTADAGSSFDVAWTVANVVGSDDLSATGTFSIVSFTATTITLDVTLDNTTSLTAALTNADLLSIGFGVSPDATASFVSAGSVFDQIGAGSGPQQTFPGDFKGIDVCISGQGCSGGAVAEGLHAGDSDSFRIALTGDFSSGSADLLYFGAKFQTNVGSFEPGGSPAIPEPSAALIFGIGALLVSKRSWRR